MEPFFKGCDNHDQLNQITKILGTEELYEYVNKYKIPLEIQLERILGSYKSVKLSSLVNSKNKHLASPEAINLVEKMMVYDHVDKI